MKLSEILEICKEDQIVAVIICGDVVSGIAGVLRANLIGHLQDSDICDMEACNDVLKVQVKTDA